MADINTVGDLIAALEKLDESLPVMLATQPADPMAHEIESIRTTRADDEWNEDVVWIGARESFGYAPAGTYDFNN